MKSDMFRLWIASANESVQAKRYLYNNFSDEMELKKVIHSNKIHLPNIINTDRLIECYNKLLEKNIMSYMDCNDIKLVMEDDIDYPEGLKRSSNAPVGLFYKGDISKVGSRKTMAVIGSRKSTRYGEDVTACIIEGLKNYNINIASGLARGIDTMAHVSALNNGLNTVAVLGSGIDVVYPPENRNLFERIIEAGGCIISEYPLGTPAYGRNFPMRNRIISGISDLILVTEAGERSGTMITVGAALDQGKDVMAVPGSIFSPGSAGTNALIEDGAFVFKKIEDIIVVMHLENEDLKNYSAEYEKAEENQVLLKIINETPIHIEEIIRRTNIDIKQLYKLLFELQVKDEITSLGGNNYVRKNKSL